MKIGLSPSYITAMYGELFSYENVVVSIRRASEAGFEGLELEVFNEVQLEIYTRSRTKEISELYNSLGLELP